MLQRLSKRISSRPLSSTRFLLNHRCNMAFWRIPSVERDPILKLLEEFDNVRGSSSRSSSVRAFQPKFDVTETKDAYELHGELPGINQKDVDIEFVDRST